MVKLGDCTLVQQDWDHESKDQQGKDEVKSIAPGPCQGGIEGPINSQAAAQIPGSLGFHRSLPLPCLGEQQGSQDMYHQIGAEMGCHGSLQSAFPVQPTIQDPDPIQDQAADDKEGGDRDTYG